VPRASGATIALPRPVCIAFAPPAATPPAR
jgi:hypothetical protein